jgi:hypothetical protein
LSQVDGVEPGIADGSLSLECTTGTLPGAAAGRRLSWRWNGRLLGPREDHRHQGRARGGQTEGKCQSSQATNQ